MTGIVTGIVTGIEGTTQLPPSARLHARRGWLLAASCWAMTLPTANCSTPAASSDAASRDGAPIIYFRTIRLVTHSIRQSALLRPPYWSCALEAVLKKDPSTRHWPPGGLSSRPGSGNRLRHLQHHSPFDLLTLSLSPTRPHLHPSSPPCLSPRRPQRLRRHLTAGPARLLPAIAIRSSLFSVCSTCVSLGDFNCAFTTTSLPSVVRFPAFRILPRLFFLCAAFRDRRIAWPVVPSGA